MKLMKNKLAITLFSLAAMSLNAFADDTTDAVKSALEARYPATTFTDVKPTPIHGLYEVVMGRNIGYTDAVGKYMLFGHLFDMKEQKDLTADEIATINKVDVALLPIQDAIKTVRGKGERVMYVFSDPECPFCKKLEPELAKIENVTIYTFLFPLEGLHPGTSDLSKKIWCAKNPSAAWDSFMTTGVLNKDAEQSKDCKAPIDRNMQKGQQLGINGTPTIIFSNGVLVPGALPAAEIEKNLSKSKVDTIVKVKFKLGS